MKLIPLTQGKYAIVDDDKYKYLMQWKWFAHKDHTTYYAQRSVHKNRKYISMHRLLVGAKKGEMTDHVNHNGLDNRLKNLRICSRSQNNWNRLPEGGTSKYKGVTWHRRCRRWQSQIRHNNKRIYLGFFVSEIEAAKAYDKKARELFGEFTYTNFEEVKEGMDGTARKKYRQKVCDFQRRGLSVPGH